MREQEFTKEDWMLFRNKIAGWQENYMDRLNKEYIELLSEDIKPSEKFWKLIYNIISLINEDAICFEDLEEFSDGLKKVVSLYMWRELYSM